MKTRKIRNASFSLPCEENGYLVEYVNLMRESLRNYTGRDLVGSKLKEGKAAKELFYAPFALVSHDTSEDPFFNYANQTALDLFEMSWEEFTSIHSRESAERPDQEERARLLKEVSKKGFIENYSGVRIAKSGKRFFIEKALVWNLVGRNQHYYGQAATFSQWKFI